MVRQAVYRVAVVGCGRIGSEWDADPHPAFPLTHAGAFAVHPRTQLVAGVNRGQERLEAFGRKWGVKALYHDHRAMLVEQRPDIVCIATHPEQHGEQVIAAAEAGVKGILCEKPIALSLAETDAMLAACRRAGTALVVNHSRRWSPVFHQARDLVAQGAIGTLLTVVGVCQGIKPSPAWRSDEEGPLLHDATHTFDMFRFFGGEVAWVLGTAVRRQRPYRVEDESMAILQFESGVSGIAIVNELTEYARFDIELQGTHGAIVLSLAGNSVWTSVPSPRMGRERERGFEWQDLVRGPFPPVPQRSTIALAAGELVSCLDGDVTPTSSGEDGRAALEIVMAIYESQRRGNVRVALPLPSGPSSLHAMRAEGSYDSADG
ncbi:MAG: Gfo/Idh/MocA family oxidoreductase [Anaerolineae bacterium]|nr:Gfo/Idh/MocA family oxidoreductase [Anaerolineae bacterium]